MPLSSTLLARGRAAATSLSLRSDRLLVSLMLVAGIATLSVVASGCLQSTANIELLSSSESGSSSSTAGSTASPYQGSTISLNSGSQSISGGAFEIRKLSFGQKAVQ